ncbi:uncharacterized protein knl1 isoform X7 [Scomber scombrus]|uniref:Uncharacterized protein knl1 isoform X7 n=1 Tax=Scomber scombrus TaxID=13677 RepID=A0AAV1PVC8_SCOSC
MEPLDPAKTEESSGFSKRRISSILKAPRKSIIFPDPVQQENAVKCAKPVEKRSSRRVSFAAANNVLLFSEDVNKASPTQSHLQELMTTTGATTQNRVSDGGIQQITGMETLLNAPLHASQQRDKVNFESGHDIGEKTMLFSDDADMDMTHSHTINIANDKELLGDKTMMFTADNASMDMTQSHTVNLTSGPESLSTGRNMDISLSSSVPGLDPGFKSFLASLSKPSGSSVNPVITRMTPTPGASSNSALAKVKTQRADVDKENQAPTSSIMERSQNKPRTSYGGALCPEDMTKAQTGRIFDFLPQIKFNTLDDRTEKTVRFTANDAEMDLTQSHTVNIATDLKQRFHQNVDFLPNCGDKTVRFSADDAVMDVTKSLTVNIDTYLKPQLHQNVDFLPTGGEKTVRFSADDVAMDVTKSLTVNIATDFKPQLHQNVDFLPTGGEKTVRFSADDAAMDVTKSLTVNIATDLKPQLHQNVDFLPTGGEKTLRFSADDAAMDVTKSLTVNIATDLKPQLHQNVDFLPTIGEKTVRFTANDAAMDVTKSLTVNIVTDLKPQLHQDVDFLPTSGEKTVRFTANDAAMDVTRSHTVNIATDLEWRSHQNVDFLPTGGEKTMRFTGNDAAMDMTQCVTTSNLVSDSVLSQKQDLNILSTCGNMDIPLTAKKTGEKSGLRRNRSSSALSLDPGFQITMSKTRGSCANPVTTKAVTTSFQEAVDTNVILGQLKTQKAAVDNEHEAPGVVSTVMEKSVNKTTKNEDSSNGKSDRTMDDVSIDLMEGQTGRVLGETCTHESSQGLSSTQDSNVGTDHLKKTDISLLQGKEALGPSNHDGGEISNLPASPDSNETEPRKEAEPRNETRPSSLKLKNSPTTVDHDVDAFPSRKSRRMSLADLQLKARRLSHMINTSPDATAMDSSISPLPQLDHDLDTTKTKSLPVVEPELEMDLVNTEENTQAQCLPQVDPPSTTTTPFKLNTKQLMSRLSMGDFKPKLPQRSKTGHPKKMDLSHVNAMGEHTRTITISVPNQLTNLDANVSDINDEELHYEDLSETMDTSPQNFISAVKGKKRPSPEDENNSKDEKRMKESTEMSIDIVEKGLQSSVTEYDGNITAAPSMTTHTIDSSNNTHTTSSKCESTFETTFKHSIFESQLEDYASDVQKKLDDGSITAREFFKLFNIDFVIHNPRQSVLPSRPDTDRTPMDLLKNRHIIRPKQIVYEKDVLNLTEQVEGLKVRMQDLDKPLKMINGPLWEEIRHFSEKELKSFGTKLKERNNFFRKTSKVQSHKMKEVLYTNVVQANREEQQKLRGTIEEADEMIKSLDNCISGLETELAIVEEKDTDDKPSLKSLQEGLKQITETVADKEQQMAELEMQKKQNLSELNRLRDETRNLESHYDVLNMLNEWRLTERKDNCHFYTFLYETLYLQVVYENSTGADNEAERKISDISFKFQLDDEKSQCHARLVHRLVSQYIEEQTASVEKYPTHRDVRMLLHDVSLVVSHCRLLGEEVRLLDTWGGLRLDIVDISCVDNLIRIIFSSLKKFAKFEVTFSVSLTGYLYVLELQSFKNKIGSTTIQQIEEAVASFSPARNLLTKIVNKIHENLLR